MELSHELKIAIEEEINAASIKELTKNSEKISSRYREESGEGKNLICKEDEASTYAIVRMPATYGAVSFCIREILSLTCFNLKTLIDVGAGTGAATLAIENELDLSKITCLEREESMSRIGTRIMKKVISEDIDYKWNKYDITRDEYDENADIVVSSYMLNELSETNRSLAIKKLYKMTNKVLLIVEPGTKIGSANLLMAREELIKIGAHIIAPCPHENRCKLSSEEWCHFSCRIPRTKLHRMIKKGEVPYEDEKFTYIAVCKGEEPSRVKMRILRHPKIAKGRVSVNLCTQNEIENRDIYKKEGEIYKQIRKSSWGDGIR